MSEFKAKLPLFVFLGLLLIGALYYGMIYMPMQKEIQAMRTETQQLEREIQFYDLYVQEIGALRSKVSELKQGAEDYKSEYFRLHGKTILSEMKASFDETGVRPSEISVGSPSVLSVQDGVRVMSLPLTVKLYGAYEQISAFLKFYEENEFSFFRVVSVEMGDVLRNSNAVVHFVMVYPQKRG